MIRGAMLGATPENPAVSAISSLVELLQAGRPVTSRQHAIALRVMQRVLTRSAEGRAPAITPSDFTELYKAFYRTGFFTDEPARM